MRTRIRYISREQWGARPPKAIARLTEPVARLWLHHTASHFPREPKWSEKLFLRKACEYVRGTQNFHMDVRGWDDIGYTHIVIKPFLGKLWVFEGRGWGVVGAHTQGDNSNSYGISVAGNFEIEKAGRKLVLGLRELFDRYVDNGHVQGPRHSIPTGDHSAAPGASTACAGSHLRTKLGQLRKPVKEGRK